MSDARDRCDPAFSGYYFSIPAVTCASLVETASALYDVFRDQFEKKIIDLDWVTQINSDRTAFLLTDSLHDISYEFGSDSHEWPASSSNQQFVKTGIWPSETGEAKGFIPQRMGYIDLYMRLLFLELSKRCFVECVDSDDRRIVSYTKMWKHYIDLSVIPDHTEWKNDNVIGILNQRGWFGGYKHLFQKKDNNSKEMIVSNLIF